MLKAFNGKVVLKKYEKEDTIQGVIYMPTVKQLYYEVVDIDCDNCLINVGDQVVVRKEDLYSVYHENQEYFIASCDDILAKVV